MSQGTIDNIWMQIQMCLYTYSSKHLDIICGLADICTLPSVLRVIYKTYDPALAIHKDLRKTFLVLNWLKSPEKKKKTLCAIHLYGLSKKCSAQM